MIVHSHSHPHLLLLKPKAIPGKGAIVQPFQLPGGRLNAAEDELMGLQRCLREQLNPPSVAGGPVPVTCKVTGLLGTWWQPTHAREVYPYLPVRRDSSHTSPIHMPTRAIEYQWTCFPRRCTLVHPRV